MLAGVVTTVLTVNVSAVEATDVLPAGSVALAVTVYEPSVKAVVGVKVHSPVTPAVTVAKGVAFEPSYSLTVLLASASPDKVGLLIAVVPVGPVSVGADGGAVSILKMMAAEAADCRPDAFVVFAVIE